MSKSIFTRYLTLFAVFILAAFMILAGIISTQVSGYYTRYNRELLDRSSNSMCEYIENEYRRFGSDDLSEFISNFQSRLSRNLTALIKPTDDTVIFAVDRQGVLFLQDTDQTQLRLSKIESSVLSELKEQNGKISGKGDLGGMLAGDYLYSARLMESDGEIIGAAFSCTSTDSLNLLIREMVKTVLMTILWIMLATLIGVYVISERITRPLKDMSRAAKSFAQGQFDVRVTVMGNDEVSELAAAFNQMAESLSKQEELRRSFLANVSHDLRTPMTTIGGFIDGILDGAIPKEKEEYYLKIIAQEVRRLSRLVNSLLDISRIQAGERKFNPEAFDICEMGRQILISFEQKIEAKHLDVSFDVDRDSMFVMADRDAVYQIFYNICDNAVKFSAEGGRYQISITEKEKKAQISVYNEGQGIPPEDLPFIFDRFYKSDKSRGLDKTGTGLGLFIAKTIISAHKERIWAESEVGRWCRFTFTLPYINAPTLKREREH